MTNGNDLTHPADGKNIDGTMAYRSFGLTKREYFAAVALQGMYSNHALVDQWDCENIMSENAVKAADAVIEALNAAK